MANPTPDQVQQYIAAGLPCTHLSVEGDGQHFFATIVSAEFEGLTRIRRHQRVYAALGDREVVTSPSQNLAAFEAITKDLKAETVSAALKTLFAGQGPLIVLPTLYLELERRIRDEE